MTLNDKVKAKLAEVKARLIAARRNGDDELSKVLSQDKAKLKKKLVSICEWPECGLPIKRGSRLCRMHYIWERSCSNKLKESTL